MSGNSLNWGLDYNHNLWYNAIHRQGDYNMKTVNSTQKPMAEIRKLIKVGDSTGITIPPSWLKRYGLKAGDKVAVVTDGIIKIVPTTDSR